ncbi:MAG: 2-amino-4-hydroxy-6-hydroxymethyldihydropteridine diphosphokinase [Actinobacteria bacterium]|nr:2-amino-4-hydroxy-6-hydroxymethyldihydropteridine diphosphokinase [Actinomycetota bacterium]
MAKAYLGLGSNVGDRKANLVSAVKILEKNKQIKIVGISSVYETEPEDYLDQEKFYNIVLSVETNLSPLELLYECQLIENFLKRERIIEKGPRTIDVDILLYGNQEIDNEKLKIPHPSMIKRAFVLIPLLEIEPDLTLPDGKLLKKFLNLLEVGSKVKKLENLKIDCYTE